jgi:hypothetical protein
MPMFEIRTYHKEYRTYIVEAPDSETAEERCLDGLEVPRKIEHDDHYVNRTTKLSKEDFE